MNAEGLHIGDTTLSGSAQPRRPLRITFALTVTYGVVEVLGGFETNSLALLADAGHMLN